MTIIIEISPKAIKALTLKQVKTLFGSIKQVTDTPGAMVNAIMDEPVNKKKRTKK